MRGRYARNSLMPSLAAVLPMASSSVASYCGPVQRKLNIHGIVHCQTMLPGEFQEREHRGDIDRRLNRNAQSVEIGCNTAQMLLRYRFASQSFGDFMTHLDRPMRWYDDIVSGENAVQTRCRTLVKEPRNCDGRIENDQCRPSLIHLLIVLWLTPRLISRARSSNSLDRLTPPLDFLGENSAVACTNFATGLPCRVIVISPPFSTSSSRLEGCVSWLRRYRCVSCLTSLVLIILLIRRERRVDNYQCRPSSIQDLISSCVKFVPRRFAIARSRAIAARRFSTTSGDTSTSACTSLRHRLAVPRDGGFAALLDLIERPTVAFFWLRRYRHALHGI